MKLDFDTIEFWNNLNRSDKKTLTVQMFALFPRVLGRHGDKYNKPSLWLIKEKMIINNHIRDCFTWFELSMEKYIRFQAFLSDLRNCSRKSKHI